MDPSPTFGARIREARERAGMTQAALAAAAELTPSYVCLLESGRRRPPSDRAVRRLAGALGLPVADVLQWAHMERAPRELRVAVEDLRRRAERERALREQAAAALFPLSVRGMIPAALGPGGAAPPGPGGQSPGADLVEFIDGLVEMVRNFPGSPSAPPVDAAEPPSPSPDERRRALLDAAPALLVAARASRGAATAPVAPEGVEALVAAPPALPPDILPGDHLLVRRDLVPREGDVVVTAAAAEGATVLRWHPSLPAPRGVVTEIRRPLRRA